MYFGYIEERVVLIEGLLIAWLYICNNKNILKKRKMTLGIYYLGFFLLFFALWIRLTFGRVTVDQFISTWVFSIQGLISVSQELIFVCIIFSLILPILFSLSFLRVEEWLFSRSWLQSKIAYRSIKFTSTLLIIISLSILASQYHVINLSKYRYKTELGKDYFAKKYIDPSLIQLSTTNHQKNLVLIYIESLETTYENKKLFGRDLLTRLTNPKAKSIRFKEFKQMPGADWTIAGLVATQCGIPLKIDTIFTKNKTGERFKYFLKGATCLSDILVNHGYSNYFLQGGDLRFSGKDNFLKTHHYAEIIGRSEWLKNGFTSSDLMGWGLPDDLLFQQAKSKLNQLMNSKKLFNLTILSVDTHGIEGQLSKSCRAQRGSNFKDIVECTANVAADFVDYIVQNGWLDQITVVIVGDHLAMQNAVSTKLETKAYKARHVFNMFVSNPLLNKNRDNILHVDIFPTILCALGFKYPGSKVALGYSAVDDPNTAPPLSVRLNDLEKIHATHSTAYDKLWMTG